MKTKISILYSWFIRLLTIMLPNIPLFMRLRGFLYSFMMKGCGRNFQVTSTTILNPLAGLTVGDNVYIAHNTVILGVDIFIGDNVLIGPNCVVSSSNHSFLNGSFRYGPAIPKPVNINKGSWIAANCSVLAGSFIPERSILAAGAVLNGRFESMDSIYGGVPAKFIKKY